MTYFLSNAILDHEDGQKMYEAHYDVCVEFYGGESEEAKAALDALTDFMFPPEFWCRQTLSWQHHRCGHALCAAHHYEPGWEQPVPVASSAIL